MHAAGAARGSTGVVCGIAGLGAAAVRVQQQRPAVRAAACGRGLSTTHVETQPSSSTKKAREELARFLF